MGHDDILVLKLDPGIMSKLQAWPSIFVISSWILDVSFYRRFLSGEPTSGARLTLHHFALIALVKTYDHI
jgi:hypothetical protein